MGEKNLIIDYMSVFIGGLGIILILALLWIIEKESKNNRKEATTSIVSSVIGIVFLALLIYSSSIIYNKINKYNIDLHEISLDNEVYKEERIIYNNELNEYKKELEEYNRASHSIEKPVKPNKPDKPDSPEYEGTLGDLFGGVYAPVIGLLAALTGGLAFYAQYKANQDIKDQFKLQQFESQFYEMLALHKDNINEMKIEGYEFDSKGQKHKKDTTGRKVFVCMNTELLCINRIIKYIILKNLSDIKLVENNINEIFNLSYYIFFHGISKTKNGYLIEESIFIKELTLGKKIKQNKKDDILRIFKELKNIFFELERIRDLHYNNGKQKTYINRYFKDRKYLNYFKNIPNEIIKPNDLSLIFNYKPFDGHQSRLGHYYRHLFSMVNHVVKQEELSYDERRDYLKILRAQFSIYELTLLFYNYYSGYGNNWENKYIKDKINDKGNSFFLDYRFLHNIEDDYRFHDIKPSEILQNIVEKHININKPIMSKKNCDLSTDPIFELYKNTKKVKA